MYGRNSDQGSDAMKWVVIFLLIVLVGTVVAVVLASGSFSPGENAKANAINVQNGLDQKRGEIDLKYYEPLKQAQIQREIDQIAEDERFYRQQHDQQIAQAEREYQQHAMLKDLAVRGLVAAGIVTLLIVAVGGAVRLIEWVWNAIAQQQAARQAAEEREIDHARINDFAKTLGDTMGTVEALEKEATHMRADVQQLALQWKEFQAVMAAAQEVSAPLRDQLQQLANEGLKLTAAILERQMQENASSANEVSRVNDKIIRLKSKEAK